MKKPMSKTQKVCDCGSLATRKHLNSVVCEFCYWCETSGVGGGKVEERSGYTAGRIAKPVVKRGWAWEAFRCWLAEVHGDEKFWSQRNLPREKFAALFRR